jgi:uncharacterized caspase-like protein
MPRRWMARLLLSFVLLVPAVARATTYRVAVVVGHNTGNAGEQPLHFAEDDAGKVARVLVELGGVEVTDLYLLQGKGLTSVTDALDRAGKRVAEIQKNADDRALLLFYFSGHADGEAIELGKERLAYTDLKSRLTSTGADVRLAILDSCKSGALVRAKGGKPGPSFEIKLADELTSSGEAFLTSSAADEQALESSEIRGGFFTHYFVSGLRGGADQSGDGRVTLSEAYQYAYNRTVSSSVSTGSEPQHPEYDYRLSGQGELVLTEQRPDGSRIALPEGFDRALVVHVQRDQVVAELRSDDRRTVAVAPGEYAVRLWQKGQSVAGRVKVAAAEERAVAWTELSSVVVTGVTAKGEPSLTEKRRRSEGQIRFEASYVTFTDDLEVEGSAYTIQSGALQGWSTYTGIGRAKAGYTAFQGKWRKPLSPQEFYRVVGREDLADAYGRRQSTRYRVMGTGIVLSLAGLVVTGYAYNGGDPDMSIAGLGSAVTLAGLGLFAYGRWWMNPHPVSVREAHDLAIQYNESLEAALDAEGQQASRRGSSSGARIGIVPSLTGGGAGLALVGTF